MQAFEYYSRTRVVFGAGALDRLGELARELGFRRTLLVADAGLVSAGHVEHAAKLLKAAGVAAVPFHDFPANPNTRAIEAGRDVARAASVDSIIGLGGGSSMDCAKGVNFLTTNGGRMQDYAGYGKATKPMLPMIGIPTTTGTGSEAQSYALVSDAETRVKMACGDPKAAFRVAILDPLLAVSQPDAVRAMTGYDALSHAVETQVTTRRNAVSEIFSREAWRLLAANYERALGEPSNIEVQGAMMLGAHFGGAAIENSMLGATHACANPLTARYGTVHGAAIALLLSHVVRWNGGVAGARYGELIGAGNGGPQRAAEALARRLEQLALAGKLPTRLQAAGVLREDLPALAEAAAQQWTGKFNPRPLDAAGALEVYQCAY
ncbi:MAG: iron-containing alcohol dehydrogenase [Candidatus Acidiferrales bacterium]